MARKERGRGEGCREVGRGSGEGRRRARAGTAVVARARAPSVGEAAAERAMAVVGGLV